LPGYPAGMALRLRRALPEEGDEQPAGIPDESEREARVRGVRAARAPDVRRDAKRTFEAFGACGKSSFVWAGGVGYVVTTGVGEGCGRGAGGNVTKGGFSVDIVTGSG